MYDIFIEEVRNRHIEVLSYNINRDLPEVSKIKSVRIENALFTYSGDTQMIKLIE